MSVLWVPRLANMAAHFPVKWSLACNFFGSFDWGSCPHCFADVIKKSKVELAFVWFFAALFQ